MSAREAVAIVGMAGRFPGAPDIDALWELLNSGGDAIGPVPAQRWDADAPLDRDKRIQPVGGFVDGVDEFDAAFFGVSPREAADIDPQQRLLLETAWRALEDGRIAPDGLRGSRTGVYIGASWHDYEILRKHRGLGASQHSAVGAALDVIASRLSYTLGLTGPSMTVETGCSSALVGLDLAVRAIRSGDIDAALVGGVNLILAPDVSVGLTHFGGLSGNGRCAAFGAEADGFVRGEGVIAVYLKPLRAALRDGDRVRAVVVESVVNNDGGGESLVTPSIDGQRDLLRRAYSDNGFDVDRLAYVEAHGTGTRRGDPIEATALGEMLGATRGADSGPLLLGSIKTNIGHLESAAGIAGLVKAVLCLEHGTVPPSLHSGTLNPDISFDDLNLRVVHEHTALPPGSDVHIGVNSFGWGGTNAHVVLRRAADERTTHAVDERTAFDGLGFVPVSAHTPAALRQRCLDIADLLESGASRADELTSALALRSPALSLRSAVLGGDSAELAAALRRHADDPEAEHPAVLSGRAGETGRVAFVFPGQGSQWHGLSAGLYGWDPAFTETVDACAAALKPYVEWDPFAILSGAAGPEWLDHVDQVQPVLWALSLGIAAVWRRAGIAPDVVIGHSQGEIGAATVAGLLSLDDAARIVARRSALLRSVAGTGRMLAVELPVAEIPEAIAGFEDLVALAVHNGPTSCVLSGAADAIEALSEILSADGVFCRMVQVDYASHSPGMAALRGPLRAELSGVAPLPGTVEMMSTVGVTIVTADDLGGDYWVENLCRPVLFADAMTALFESGVTHVIEISPHPVLLPALEQLAGARADPPVALPSFHRDRDPLDEIRRSRARAFVAGLRPFGVAVDTGVALPPYPLRPQSHWLPDARPAVLPGSDASRVPVYPSRFESGVWQATVIVDSETMPWLADHKVGTATVVPGAMMAALALAVTGTHLGTRPAGLAGLRLVQMLTLGDAPMRLEITLRQEFSAGARFDIASLNADTNSWTTHAHGRALSVPESSGPPEPFPFGPDEPAPGTPVPVVDFYAACSRRGVTYGPDFQGVRELRRWQDATGSYVLARIGLGDRARAHTRPGELHATLLDCAMQTALALFDDDRTVLPAGIGELLLDADPAGYVDAAWAYAIQRSDSTADIHLFDDRHAPLARILGLELLLLEDERAEARSHERELTFTWHSSEHAENDRPASSFILAGDAQASRALAAVLRHRGAAVAGAAIAGSAVAGAAVGGAAVADAAGVECGVADGSGVSGPPATVVFLAPSARSGLDAQRRGLLELGELASSYVRMTAAPPRLVVVTTAGQAVDASERPDPGGALYWGFVRVLRREHPELSAALIDLPDSRDGVDQDRLFESCAAELLTGAGGEDQVALRLERRHSERLEPEGDAEPLTGVGVEGRVARCRVGRYVGRLEQGERRQNAAVTQPWRSAAQPFRLDVTAGFGWDGLRFRPLEVRAPGPGEVLIEIDSAAADVARMEGGFRGDTSGPDPLGLECAGVVRAVGPGVTDRAAGDRVVGCGFGALATHLTVRADHTQKIPDTMDSEVAAAVSMAATAAWYALVTLGRLTAAETVLIQSGGGGSDLAAIGVARGIGARIIATAGSAERRECLREYGVEQVFDSGGPNWVDEVRAVTGGRGVDVVFDSGTDRAIDLGIEVLAEDGRFLAVGAREGYVGRRLGLDAFAKGISLAAVDLAGLMVRRPERFATALREVWERIGTGELAPVPITVHDFADAATALRNATHGEHPGALVLIGPAKVTDIAPDPLPDGRFRTNGTYVITGGHGALGRSLADHLIARGAGAVALIGRTRQPDGAGWSPGAGSETRQRPDAVVRSYQADVSDAESLAAVLDSIRAELPPLRGVFHAAGILDDATILGLDADRLERVLRPKIDGARHLDELTAADNLDLFVLFSSAAALIGSPGQCAYAAANAYLDALAQARRHAGRPGLSMQWGFFAEVGLAATDDMRRDRLLDHGISSYTTEEAWAALDTFLTEDRSVVGYMSFDPRRWFDAYPDAAAQSSWQLLRQRGAEESAGAARGEFHTAFAAADAAERHVLVRDRITEVAARVLRMAPDELDPRTPFKALGVDSLMSLELRNRLESAFALRFSPTLLWTYGTAETLAGAIGERLVARSQA
ncbi:SDR family NAD(P)-dependent oxidoreductase [Nocardia sp. 2]|uniref:SDR family NAD(P)-dependent oxidoreductase n=1 Tax=Nocardia acididurans TaxID=2802282 RepID=A0ABS1MBX1_9NOCA|nr:type I polyketide synthase [Nocardia acididurans]MBL1077520.1 SDR family NAD(P)-dependent oxidoreductase [Nocardia acididurans]